MAYGERCFHDKFKCSTPILIRNGYTSGSCASPFKNLRRRHHQSFVSGTYCCKNNYSSENGSIRGRWTRCSYAYFDCGFCRLLLNLLQESDDGLFFNFSSDLAHLSKLNQTIPNHASDISLHHSDTTHCKKH